MKEKGRRPQGKADLQMTDDDTSRRIAITASGSADQADATSPSSDPGTEPFWGTMTTKTPEQGPGFLPNVCGDRLRGAVQSVV